MATYEETVQQAAENIADHGGTVGEHVALIAEEFGFDSYKVESDVVDALVKPKGAQSFTITLPYDLTAANIAVEAGPYRTVEDSLEFLLNEAEDKPYLAGERARIITGTAALLETGADLATALETAIVWERG